MHFIYEAEARHKHEHLMRDFVRRERWNAGRVDIQTEPTGFLNRLLAQLFPRQVQEANATAATELAPTAQKQEEPKASSSPNKAA